MKIRIACKFVIIRLFKTLTRTVVTCGCEMWKLSVCLSVCLSKKKRADLLNSFERNILRRIFGPARQRERERDVVIKYNEEFYRKFKGLALNSTHHKLPDMYEDSLPSV